MPRDGAAAAESAWSAEATGLTLLLDGGQIRPLVAEAASWAERITALVTAPQSERGTQPWWLELLARNTKCDRLFVRRAEFTEGWLLHRLHETGALSLVEGGGKQVASNLLLFARGDELRVVLAHIPLERAVSGAAFGALLTFQGNTDDPIARACHAQVESWAELGRTVSGSEVDALALDPRRREPPVVAPAAAVAPRVITDSDELSERLAQWLAASDAGRGVLLRAVAGGQRLSLPGRDGAAAFGLTLQAGASWAAGNALLLDAGAAGTWLCWRGGLLGHSCSKRELCWSEACLPSVTVDAAALGGAQRLAVVAHSGLPLAPQLERFAREVARLGEAFGVEPPPALGHVLASFATLSAKQQTLLVWRSLLGAGALELGEATRAAVDALRDMGYLRGEEAAQAAATEAAIAELVQAGADVGHKFDRLGSGHVRAIQPDLSAYVAEDWLECVLSALPDAGVVSRLAALRLAFEHARSHFGLNGQRLARGSAVERALERALASALRRGLVLRVGADGFSRLGQALPCPPLPPRAERVPGEPERSFIDGFAHALAPLAPAQRFIVSRRMGHHGRRESLDAIAQRLGLSPDRARLLESEAWTQIEAGSAWPAAVRTRLGRAFSGARLLPVQRLVADDAWWRGVERQPELADGALETVLAGSAHRVELGAPGQRQQFFARFEQAELDAVFETLLARAREVETPATLDVYRPLCEAAARELDAALTEPLREALEARLELDTEDPTVVVGFAEAVSAALETFPVEPRSVDSEALLRLEDVLRSVFRAAGTPLSLEAVAERVGKRLDVDLTVLAQRLSAAPFVQRNADQYGVLARDVPGGAEAIATVLDDVTETLARTHRALDAAQCWALAQTHVALAWSPELVRSVIASDPALYLSPTQATTLRRWEHTRLPSEELVCPGIPGVLRARFDKLVQQPLAGGDKLARRVASELSSLERSGDADDLGGVPLARQLCDLSQRLLAHVSGEDAATDAPLVYAATQCFLDALSNPDDDDGDGSPRVDRERLLEARAVFVAVLRWLGLDWL